MTPTRHHITKNQIGLIAGIFYSYSSTLSVYEELCENGSENSEICMVMSLETWKELFLDVLDGVDVDKPDKHQSFAFRDQSNIYQQSAKMKALICSSDIMSGPGIMLAGPIKCIHSQGASNRVEISEIFQKWGLPESLSKQYKEEILCGGIMIGTTYHVKLHGKTLADHWQTKKYAYTHIGQSALMA